MASSPDKEAKETQYQSMEANNAVHINVQPRSDERHQHGSGQGEEQNVQNVDVSNGTQFQARNGSTQGSSLSKPRGSSGNIDVSAGASSAQVLLTQKSNVSENNEGGHDLLSEEKPYESWREIILAVNNISNIIAFIILLVGIVGVSETDDVWAKYVLSGGLFFVCRRYNKLASSENAVRQSPGTVREWGHSLSFQRNSRICK
eukprot:gb/GECG01008655.1/.p1 GENE.gb/GECG01008655.1/~~gb/GECG01008655.1/.p1  ORF type:complete len:203 (+),score=31.65 gb/GECG01008655.1/:1-609(+)